MTPRATVSIHERLVFLVGALMLCVIVFQIIYFPARYRQSALQGLQGKALAVVKMLAYDAGPALEFDDRKHVREIMEAAGRDEELVFVAIYRGDGSLYESYDHGVHAPPRLHWNSDVHVESRDDMVVVTAPLQSRRESLGGVVTAFSTAGIVAAARDNTLVTLAIGLITLFMGIMVARRFADMFTVRIKAIVQVAQQLAAGNLRQAPLDPGSRDELGFLAESVNELLRSQQHMVRQIYMTARQIKGTSSDILQSARQQELGATEQSSAVEETRHTMEALLQSGKQIGSSAHLVLQNAERTQSNNQLINERITLLSSHVERITEILEVIKDIANKSEMLALNASLEGTKAGEAGRSFSMVASQMQGLAENVMGAVRDIKTLTGDVRESTQASVLATEDGTKLAADTTRSARQIGLIIGHQQSGTEQVTRAMDDVSHIAQQTAAASRQSLKTTQTLTLLSEQLDMLVRKFKIDSEPAP